MALSILRYEVTVSFMESSGETVNRTYEADHTAYADFDAFLADVLGAAPGGFIAQLNSLTDAVISKVAPAAVYVENALVLPTDVENQTQALISAKIDGDPTDSATLSIPAPVIDMFVSPTGEGRNTVNTAYAPLVLWMDNFVPANAWTLSDGESIEITTLKGHRRSVKASRT